MCLVSGHSTISLIVCVVEASAANVGVVNNALTSAANPSRLIRSITRTANSE
jgi:hypothetical protein